MNPDSGQFDGALQYLDTFLKLAVQPVGIALLATCLFLGIYTLLNKKFIWILYVVWLGIGVAGVVDNRWYNTTLIGPLEILRQTCKYLFFSILSLICIRYFVFTRSESRGYSSSAAKLLFIAQLAMAIRGGYEESALRIALAIAACFLLYIATYLTISSQSGTIEEIHKWFFSIMMGGGLFLALCSMQLIVSPSQMAPGGRFQGYTSNAQTAAIYLVFCCVVSLYFAVQPTHSRIKRILMILVCCVTWIMLIWTGSRTGLLMALAGSVVLAGTNIRRLLPVGIIVILIFALIYYGDLSYAAFERLFEAKDTRSSVYVNFLPMFLENPVIGNPNGRLGVENFFLMTLGYSGLVGFFFVIASIICQLNSLRIIRKYSFVDPRLPLICNLLVALSLALFLGSLFEAFLYALSTSLVVLGQMVIGLTESVRIYTLRRISNVSNSSVLPVLAQ